MSPSLAVDLLIAVVLIIYLIDGYRRGFLLLLIELVGTLATFYFSWIWAEPTGRWLQRFIDFPAATEQLVGLVFLWLVLQLVYVIISTILYRLIPEKIRQSALNRAIGIVPSAFKGLVMVAVILTVIVVLPIETKLRPAVLNSRFGKPLVTQTQALQQRYSQELSQSLTFLTTTPIVRKTNETGEAIRLHFQVSDGKPDPTTEATMLRLVNQERVKVGLGTLSPAAELTAVGRAHADDMLKRSYFSHYTPEGKDPFDRLQAAGVSYGTAGENLAFAPTVELAHVGLMNSPKHRDNILFAEFNELGVGVIDAGVYGKMFVQIFRD